MLFRELGDAASRWPADVVPDAQGAAGRGHDGAGANGWGQGARMGPGRIEVDGADCERVVQPRRRRDRHAGRAN